MPRRPTGDLAPARPDNPLAKRARYLRGRARADQLDTEDLATLEQLPGWHNFITPRD